MRNPFKSGTPESFFWKNAGYSYGANQSPAEGRRECAVLLALAEGRGRVAGLSFDWDVDPVTDSSDFSEESPAWSLWECVCRDESGSVVASLHGIDFGRDGEPWGDPYRRVVQAELSAEAIPASAKV